MEACLVPRARACTRTLYSLSLSLQQTMCFYITISSDKYSSLPPREDHYDSHITFLEYSYNERL